MPQIVQKPASFEEVRNQLEGATSDQIEKLRLLTTLKKTHWFKKYYDFLGEGLGFAKADFPQFNKDPGVREVLDEYGKILNRYYDDYAKGLIKSSRRVLVLIPRDTCKTSCITVPTPINALARDPNMATLVMSAEFDKMATKMVRGIKGHLEGQDANAQLTSVCGQFNNGKRTWTDTKMIVAQRKSSHLDPSISTYSVDTGATGAHVRVGVLDDLVGKAQLDKHGDAWLDKCWEQFFEMNAIVARNGLLVVVATRYHEMDLSGCIIKYEIEPQVRAKVQPGAPEGELPEDFKERWAEYANKYSDWEVIYRTAYSKDKATGETTYHFPTIWNEESIEKARRDPTKGSAWVACQLQQNPSAREDNPIKIHHIERMWIDRENVPPAAYADLFMCADLAHKKAEAYKKQTGDWGVMFVFGQAEGMLYLVHGWHGRVPSNMFIQRWLGLLEWAQVAHDSRIHTMTLDASTGGVGDLVSRSFYDAANERGLICPRILEISRSGKSKDDRIMAVTPYWQDNRMRLVRGVDGTRELTDEMLAMFYTGHDDHIDAAADAFRPEVFKPSARGRASTVVDKNAEKRFDMTPVSFVGPDDPEHTDYDPWEADFSWQ